MGDLGTGNVDMDLGMELRGGLGVVVLMGVDLDHGYEIRWSLLPLSYAFYQTQSPDQRIIQRRHTRMIRQ